MKYKILDAPFHGIPDLNRLTRSTTLCEYRGVIDSSGNLIDYGPNEFHLTATGSPANILSNFQRSDGNRIWAASMDDSSYFSNSYDAKMLQCFNGNYTITALAKNRTALTGYNTIFAWTQWDNGIYLGWYDGDIEFQSGRTHFDFTSTWSMMTGTQPIDEYVFIQIPVVDTDIDNLIYSYSYFEGNLYLNGILSDTDSQMVQPKEDGVGFSINYDNYDIGNMELVYLRIDGEAITDTDELGYERQIITGCLPGTGGRKKYWTFSRASDAYNNFSNKTLGLIHDNIPRIGDGILIESQGTNLCEYSESFNDWTKYRLTVPSGTELAPDGTLTADILHEDNTLANTHLCTTNAFSATSGDVYTISVYLKAINRSWVRLSFGGSPFNGIAYFNLSTGNTGNVSNCTAKIESLDNNWFRCSITDTASSTNVANLSIYIADSNGNNLFDGLDQDSIYVWGAQIEESSYPTSYIPNLSTGTSTRIADDITISPSDIGLPAAIGYGHHFDKLTIQFDAKCLFSSSSDISYQQTLVGISGNTGISTTSRNIIEIFVYSNGKLYFKIRGDDSDLCQAGTVENPVDYSNWHRYRFYGNLLDTSTCKIYIDEIDETSSAQAGTNKILYTTDSMVRIGQLNTGQKSSNFLIKNLRIWVER